MTIVNSNNINNNSTHAALFFFWLLLPRALSGAVGRWMGHAIVSEEVSDTRAKLHLDTENRRKFGIIASWCDLCVSLT